MPSPHPLCPTLTMTRMATLDVFPIPSGGKADAARSTSAHKQRLWIPASDLAAELGISRRTLARLMIDAALGFPQPKIVNHRLYFERNSIEAWKTATAVKVAGAR